MSSIKESAFEHLDLMAPSIEAPARITLQDFLGLTNGLPGETALMAIVVDDDEVAYTRTITSAAVRCERDSRGKTTKQIELTVEVEC